MAASGMCLRHRKTVKVWWLNWFADDDVPRRWRVENAAVVLFFLACCAGWLTIGFPHVEFLLFLFGAWIGHEVTQAAWVRRWRDKHATPDG